MSDFNWSPLDTEMALAMHIDLNWEELQYLMSCACKWPRYDTLSDGRVLCQCCRRKPPDRGWMPQGRG